MKELDFISTIKRLTNSSYIGDDCAYLDELGIVISQDSLVEDVHFKREWISPMQLGYKSVIVNISDIIASGAEPAYITVALSLPKDIETNFIAEFYRGVNKALNGAVVVGGDITASEQKIFVSITAIGKTNGRKIASRANARPGYLIITKGNYGSSAKGLEDLYNGTKDSCFVNEHLEPSIDIDFSKKIATCIKSEYAMMDTSDGLADALYKIAEASNVKIIVDEKLIPHDSKICDLNLILFGGEDYNLVAAVPEDFLNVYSDFVVIGKVLEKKDDVLLQIGNKTYLSYDELGSFNHFGV